MKEKKERIKTFWKGLFQDYRRYGVYVIPEKELFSIINNLLILYDKYKSEPLEHIPEEKVEPLQNGERGKISKILVRYGMPTKQIAINKIVELLSQARREGRMEGYQDCLDDEAKEDREKNR